MYLWKLRVSCAFNLGRVVELMILSYSWNLMFLLRGSDKLSLCETTVSSKIRFGNLLTGSQPGLCYPTRGIMQNLLFSVICIMLT